MDPLDFAMLNISGIKQKEATPDSSNELLELLRKRKEDSQKESLATIIAGGVGELLAGGTDGSVAKYGADLALSRMKQGDQAESDMFKYQMAEDKAKKDASSTTGKRRYQAIPVEENGNVVYKSFDSFTGDAGGKSLGVRGFSPFIGKDTRTGEHGRMLRGQAGQELVPVATQGQAKTKFDEKQKEVFRKIKGSLEKNPQYAKAKEGYSASQRAIEVLQSENPIGDQGIKVIFPRMFGEVGNLAAQEQANFSGSPELLRVWDRMFDKYKKGKLTEEDRSDLMKIANVMGEYDARRMKNTIGEQAKSEGFLEDVRQEDVEQYLGIFSPKPLKAGTIAKRAAKDSTRVEGNVITTPDGRKFRRKSNGKYEELK